MKRKSFADVLREEKSKLEEGSGEVKKAPMPVGSLSSATSGKLFSGSVESKKEMAYPRPPQKGKTEEAFQYYRKKLREEPKSEERRKQMMEFLRSNPSYKSAK